MADIEIKRGYEVLSDNRVRFGIRVINNGNFAISEVQVLLDYSHSLFELEGSRIEELGTIPPSVIRTAKFTLKPLSCVHNEKIGATVIFRDHKWEKHTPEMRPKEIHCVCPFLKEKSLTRSEFLKLLNEGYSAEHGLNFENISPEKLVEFLSHTCKNRLYKVDEFSIENGKVLYLAGESLGEKAYYLLTAVVIEREEIVQVLLHVSSDKSFGIHGFLNEILENLRHLVRSVNSAREIGIIKNEQVINIIDSVVQHTKFSGGIGSSSVNIQDSVTQRTNFGSFEDENRKKEAEEKLRRQQEEKERLRKEKEEQERLRRQQEEETRLRKAEEERLLREKEEEEKRRLKEIEEQKRLRKQREEEAKKLEEIKRKAQEEAERRKKEQEKKQQAELHRQREEAEQKQKEETERKRKEKEVQERKQREEQERKHREEEEKLHRLMDRKAGMYAKRRYEGVEQERKRSEEEENKKKEKEVQERRQQEEKERKRREEEEKRREEEEKFKREWEEQKKLRKQKEETERKAREKLERKKLEEASKTQTPKQTVQSPAQKKVSPKKPESSSGKGVLVFSLIFGVLLIGAVVVFLGLDDGLNNVAQDNDISQEAKQIQDLDTYTNSIGIEFVEVPAGEFMMGASHHEEGRYHNEGPVHKVTIEYSYYIGKYEVTQKQWDEVMDSHPSHYTYQSSRRPVECVSWNDVQEFITKLNAMEGTDKYRLPSEAEWEYACRAGTTTRYYFGDNSSELGKYATYGSWNLGTSKVGQNTPNAWGLYDMHGNVREWVQDRWYDDDYDGAPSDGSAWESLNSLSRGTRGGGSWSDAMDCRAASRSGEDPGTRSANIGFRLVMDV